MISKLKLSQTIRNIVSVLFAIAAGYGLFLFLRNNMADYMFFRVPFAFLDYEKSKVLVILENLLMLGFWVFIGVQAVNLCLSKAKKRNPLLPVVSVVMDQVGEAGAAGRVLSMLGLSADRAYLDHIVLISVASQLAFAFGLLVISILSITPGRRFLLRTERKRGRKDAGENG